MAEEKSDDKELSGRLKVLTRLRWISIAGILITVSLAMKLGGLPVSLGLLLIIFGGVLFLSAYLSTCLAEKFRAEQAKMMTKVKEPLTLESELKQSYFDIIKTLAAAIEVRDPYSRGHSERVTQLSLAIAERLGLSEEEKMNLKYAAILHDIGKVGVRNEILLKSTGLNDEEYGEMKLHPRIGYDMIKSVSFLQGALPGIIYHHERLDGKGYPGGIAQEEIPLLARIIGVADAYDAMTNERPYREVYSQEKAVAELRKGMGSQFDGRVVEALLESIK